MHHHFHHFFGRHRPHHGMGRFGHGFMDGGFGGFGGRGFGSGRKLGSAELQLLILALLEEKPRHGYEIIKALDERSNGFYAPSPGMVYPALTYLEEIGHATVQAEGTRKLYAITAAGKQHLDDNRTNAEALLTQLSRIGERMDRVRRAFDSGEAESAEREPRLSEELQRARHALRAALQRALSEAPHEQQRIAEVLMHAAAEILKPKA
jgi:DNA-binding PadR family transcriptional regulator